MANHILVADDEPALREALESTLKAEKFKVSLAKDGADALAQIKKDPPDLILLDIAMPKMDGIGVMHNLQNDPKTKNIPIIFLTNMSDVETISKAVRGGIFDYLVKTEWDIDELVALVKRRLKKK